MDLPHHAEAICFIDQTGTNSLLNAIDGGACALDLIHQALAVFQLRSDV